MDKTTKPLGTKCYGHICHLPGSRLGPGDHKLNEGQTRILTSATRDKYDIIIVQEKLDGSNVGVARLNEGTLIPLIRAGYPAISSKFEQHRFFAAWVYERLSRFDSSLPESVYAANGSHRHTGLGTNFHMSRLRYSISSAAASVPPMQKSSIA